jgi:replication-associated recombination protein RarA
MEQSRVFILDLPNISNQDLFKLMEQLILQSDKLFEGYRIENKDIIVDTIVKQVEI